MLCSALHVLGLFRTCVQLLQDSILHGRDIHQGSYNCCTGNKICYADAVHCQLAALELSVGLYHRFAAFFGHEDCFDAGMFSIAATEAAAMDPQQRILLEQTHIALVDSAACKGRLVEASTGLPSMVPLSLFVSS